jgi:Protein of unknown function (DUF3352)
VRRLFVLILSAALVAGCGGGSGSKQPASPGAGTPGGASVAPFSTPFLLRLNTGFDSPQWKAFDGLLRRFPDGTKLYSSIAGEDVDFNRDVKPALGPETDVLALTLEDLNRSVFVGLTQPQNEAKFLTLLTKNDSTPPISEEIAGWHVIADDRATIDRFKQARNEGVLSGSTAYKDATEELPADALATLYVNGNVLTRAIARQAKTTAGPVPGIGRIGWLSGALTAQDKGLALDFRLKGDEFSASPFTAELPAEVPAGVSLFVDFKGLDAALEQLRRSQALEKQFGSIEQALGGLLDEVIALFKNEGAVYIRPGATGSEYSLVLKVDDEAAAGVTLDKLGTLVGAFAQKAPEQVDVAGVSAKKIEVGENGAVYYAVFDGKLVLTNAEAAIRALKGGGQRLADSQAWQDLKTSAGLPDQTVGIFYADIQKLVPLLQGLGKDGKPLSAEAKRNLAPLGAVLLYGAVNGNVATAKGFVSVR